MPFEIRTAALEEDVRQRLGLAIARLRVFQVQARVAEWDGTRCDLLVAGADDAYGFKILQLAMRRDMPVLAIGEPLEPLPIESLTADSSPATLATAVRVGLGSKGRVTVRSDAAPMPAAAPRSRAPICRLAIAPLRGHAVDVHRGGRILMLRPQTGRVYAASHSDLLAGGDSFMDPRWGMTIADPLARVADAASAGLESFLLRAAYRGKAELPDFPAGRYRLEAWPDLGALPSLLSALHIAKELVGGSASPADLYASSHPGTERGNVNACLWGLAAANLLIDVVADAPAEPDWSTVTIAPRPRPQRLGHGVWSRLARRFGLLTAASGSQEAGTR